MRRPLVRNGAFIAFAILTLLLCFTAFSQWNRLPLPLPVSADLPSLITNAPGAFTLTALPVNFEANAINNRGEVVGTWDTHEILKYLKTCPTPPFGIKEKCAAFRV